MSLNALTHWTARHKNAARQRCRIAIITGRTSRCVEMRAKNLGIEHVYQGVEHKLDAIVDLLDKINLRVMPQRIWGMTSSIFA